MPSFVCLWKMGEEVAEPNKSCGPGGPGAPAAVGIFPAYLMSRFFLGS